MGLLELLLIIGFIGFICWVFTTVFPMPDPFRKIIYAICVVAAALVLYRALWPLIAPYDIKL